MKFIVDGHDIGGHISLMGDGEEVMIGDKSNGTRYQILAKVVVAYRDHYKHGVYAKESDFATYEEVITCLFKNSDNWQEFNSNF